MLSSCLPDPSVVALLLLVPALQVFCAAAFRRSVARAHAAAVSATVLGI